MRSAVPLKDQYMEFSAARLADLEYRQVLMMKIRDGMTLGEAIHASMDTLRVLIHYDIPTKNSIRDAPRTPKTPKTPKAQPKAKAKAKPSPRKTPFKTIFDLLQAYMTVKHIQDEVFFFMKAKVLQSNRLFNHPICSTLVELTVSRQIRASAYGQRP